MILNRVEWGEKKEITETEVGNAISSLPCFVLWNLPFYVSKPKLFLKHIFIQLSFPGHPKGGGVQSGRPAGKLLSS